MIINQIVKGSGGGGTVPDYYVKKTIDGNGKLVLDSLQTTVSTSPATDVGNNAMIGALAYERILTAFDGSSLTTVSGIRAFAFAFAFASSITSYDFSNLTTISGTQSFNGAFNGSSNGATSVSFPALTTLTGTSAFSEAFANNSIITNVTFGNTAAITFGSEPFGGAYDGMFNYCSQNITVNAPLANKAEIEAMAGYPSFGSWGTVTWNWVS